MGAVRITVGHIAVDFPEEEPMEVTCELDGEPHDILENNDIDGMHRIDKWARS